MRVDRSRRRLALFALVVALPCVVLVGLSVHALKQERELAESRRAEEEARRAREVRDLLASQLERVRLAVVAGEETPGVEVLARIRDNRLVLPWEEGRDPRPADPSFRSTADRGERIEFGAGGPARAIPIYRQLLSTAETPAQTGHARLLTARALTRAGRREEATAEYRQLLGMSLLTVDEEGVPFALYAADRLLEEGTPASRDAVIQRLARIPEELDRTLSPVALYLLDDLLSKIEISGGPVEDARRAVAHRLETAERALEIREDWESLRGMWREYGSTEAAAPGVWARRGNPSVLLSRVDTSEGPVLAGVEPAALFRRLTERRPDLAPLRLVDGWQEGTVDLAPWIPGLRLDLPELPAPAPRSDYRRVVLGALLAVLVATVLSALLLWHDIRREVRLATLRSRFVSSVSHELKTPLTSIRMFAESLSLGRPGDPERREEYLETIVGESERLSRLIDNVLDFSKIEQGRKEYDLRPTELSAAAQAAVRALQYPLQEHGFDLTVEIDEDLPAVLGDPDGLEQAALNLLGNAMKYSGESPEIALRVYRRDAHAVLEVEDHGIGIPDREQDRIFEEFHRVASEREDVPGAGLGLTIVSHVAREHGGRVTVDSTLGEGSTFGLWIPLPEEEKS